MQLEDYFEFENLPSKFGQVERIRIKGHRISIEHVLSREINPEIVAAIRRLGGKAEGLDGSDIFTCRKLWLDDKEHPGQKIDIENLQKTANLVSVVRLKKIR